MKDSLFDLSGTPPFFSLGRRPLCIRKKAYSGNGRGRGEGALSVDETSWTLSGGIERGRPEHQLLKTGRRGEREGRN